MLTLLATALAPVTPAHAADATGERIVNGDFEYPGNTMLNLTRGDDTDWTAVERASGQRFDVKGNRWLPIGQGFQSALFGWDSSETDGPWNGSGPSNQRRANEVEIQRDINGNDYAELTAHEENTAIRQTVTTTPGAMYTVSLKHASLTRGHVDSMRVVLVAKDGAKTILPMTRMTSNGNGDKTGETSDIIATKVANTWTRDHAAQWETYRGMYRATSDTTVFTFEAVDSIDGDTGNLLDDISFQTAYPLSYDGNGATSGTLPKQIK